MNFFAALSIFHTISGSIDPTNLPLIQTTYLLDSANVPIPLQESRWEKVASQLVKNTTRKIQLGSFKIDTTISFIKMDDQNIPLRFTNLAEEDPVQNGSEYKYLQDTLRERKQYTSGLLKFSTDYGYQAGKLSKTVTSSNFGPVDTTRYTYSSDALIEIASTTPQGTTRTKYTYLGKDTIQARDYNTANVADSILSIFILRNDLLFQKNIFVNDKLIGFIVYEKAVTTGVNLSLKYSKNGKQKGKDHFAVSAPRTQFSSDVLGRLRPHYTGLETSFGLRKLKYR